MRTRWRRGLTGAVIGFGALTLAATPRHAPAQEEPRALDPSVLPAVGQALQDTMSTGRPTVIAVTSNADGASRQLWSNLLKQPGIEDLSRSMHFVELIAETAPARVQKLGIKSTPTILVYRRGAKGLELAGYQVSPRDAAAVAAWLGAPGGMASAILAVDPALMRTDFHSSPGYGPSPSAQGYVPQAAPQAPPQQAPPQQAPMAPPQQQMMMVPAAPMYAAPASPPVMVSPPSQSVFIQPQAPTIVVGQPAAPNVLYSAPAAPAATMLMAPQPVPQPAPPTFLAPAPLAAAPPQAGAGTAVIGLLLENPSLFRQLLGALGRFLSRFGNPTVRMSNVPQLAQVPLPVQGPALAPAAPSQPLYYAPEAPQAAPTLPSPQGGPLPSPQCPLPRKHGLFHHY
jgi:hypothetical protein